MAKNQIQKEGLFETKKRAVFFEDYIAFDDKYPFAVQILDKNNKEIDMEVFETKEAALVFKNTYNK